MTEHDEDGEPESQPSVPDPSAPARARRGPM